LATGLSLKFASFRGVEVNALAQGALRRFTQWHIDRTHIVAIVRRSLYS